MSLQFELPVSLSAEKFIAKLGGYVAIQQRTRMHTIKTYYDSFDWRLYSNDMLCDFTHSKTASKFTLTNFQNEQIIITTALDEVPAFAKQFKSVKIRSILEPLLGIRALLSQCSLEYEVFPLDIINVDKKIALHLFIEEHVLFNDRLIIQPIKSNDKVAEYIVDLLTTKLDLTPIDNSLLLSALKHQGRRPKEYSSKLAINLEPDMRADIASKAIYLHLLKTIKDNEQGTINDTDSEFLHDFRVAVRRTRAGLSQIKDIFPKSINDFYTEFFSWLGQATSPTRDLDVYLLNFERYKNSLPVSMRKDLQPLHDFLQIKQQQAQNELAQNLRSNRYSSTLAEWEHYLKEETSKKSLTENAKLTIRQLADLRIWKVFKRVLKEGDAITEQSAPPVFHELRKTCKKLRYLMEFFQSLYSEKAIKQLINSLKELQDVLGGIQDLQVQEDHLKLFREEMQVGQHISANTLIAIDRLISNLELNRRQARNDFGEKYEAFKQAENQAVFKMLFAC